MIILSRLRIFILAMLVLGVFASFARNEWGILAIVLSQVAMAITFATESYMLLNAKIHEKDRKAINRLEMLILGAFVVLCSSMALFTATEESNTARLIFFVTMLALMLFAFPFVFIIIELVFCIIKRKEKKYLAGILENQLLLIGFTGAFFKNMFWFGASVLLVAGILGLCLFYSYKAIVFFFKNFRSGKTAVLLVTLAYLSAIMFGISAITSIWHWQFANVFLCIGFVLIPAIPKRKFDFHGEKTNIIGLLRMQKGHFLLTYSLSFVFCLFLLSKVIGIAPVFYSHYYPASTYKLKSDARIHEERDAYDIFVEHCKKNKDLDF